ncbi:MAG: thioredoxin domain-containing protein, partial [Coleofasciculus sp.]
EVALNAFASVMNQSSQSCPSLFTALDWFRNSTLIRTSVAQILSLMIQYFPATMYRLEPSLPENAVGLVCQGLSCKPTAHTQEQLLAQVQKSQTRGY